MATTEIQKAKIAGIQELTEWGKFAVGAGVLPAGTTAMQAMAIIQTGNELGIQPMTALRTMQFIKGRLTLSVQLQLALARQQGVEIADIVAEEGKCTAILKRGEEKATCIYTLEMAKKAGLTSKDNWVNYPAQMLRWRAIGDALRLIAPDLILGLISTEEAQDMDIPFAFDPAAEVTPEQVKITDGDTPITKEQRVAIMQAMTVNGWIFEGQATPDAVKKLGALGYENSAQIPKKDFERVLNAFKEKAPEAVTP